MKLEKECLTSKMDMTAITHFLDAARQGVSDEWYRHEYSHSTVTHELDATEKREHGE